jgi:hypothetical protein
VGYQYARRSGKLRTCSLPTIFAIASINEPTNEGAEKQLRQRLEKSKAAVLSFPAKSGFTAES